MECDVCWGTGFYKGYGGPCSRGCLIPGEKPKPTTPEEPKGLPEWMEDHPDLKDGFTKTPPKDWWPRAAESARSAEKGGLLDSPDLILDIPEKSVTRTPSLSGECPLGLGQRFFRDELWRRLVGRHVTFIRTVTRDEFVVPKGRVGKIVEPFLDSDAGLVLAVKLRTPVPGSEPFEGEVHWREGVNLLDVELDIVVD